VRKFAFFVALITLALPALLDGLAYDLNGLGGMCPHPSHFVAWISGCSITNGSPINIALYIETLAILLPVVIVSGLAFRCWRKKLTAVLISRWCYESLFIVGLALSHVRSILRRRQQ
jgi:hypothetical protein